MVLLREVRHAGSLYNMMASRGMGDIRPAKIRQIKKRDGNEPVKVYKKGGKLHANMHAKRKRIADGSGEKMGR
jgi:hypothetical protein